MRDKEGEATHLIRMPQADARRPAALKLPIRFLLIVVWSLTLAHPEALRIAFFYLPVFTLSFVVVIFPLCS